ncbi:MAG: hypothetical protein RLZ32_2381, partial [Gemmatimonadota bacterium]
MRLSVPIGPSRPGALPPAAHHPARRPWRALLAAAGLFLSAGGGAPVAAQGAGGTISGRVTDAATGQPVA